MTTKELIILLQEHPPETPIYMACLDDDTGRGDYPLEKKDVSSQAIQKGLLGGPAGDCLVISYRSGFGPKASLN